MHVGNLTIHRARRRVLVDAEPISLTPTEYRLVSTLADPADRVVTRKDLALRLWGYEDESSGRRIEMHVRRLRAKLGATAVRGPAIVAVRGLGYKLASRPVA